MVEKGETGLSAVTGAWTKQKWRTLGLLSVTSGLPNRSPWDDREFGLNGCRPAFPGLRGWFPGRDGGEPIRGVDGGPGPDREDEFWEGGLDVVSRSPENSPLLGRGGRSQHIPTLGSDLSGERVFIFCRPQRGSGFDGGFGEDLMLPLLSLTVEAESSGLGRKIGDPVSRARRDDIPTFDPLENVRDFVGLDAEDDRSKNIFRGGG